MRQPVPEPGPGTRRKHFATNIVIRHNGDHAEVTSNFLVVRDTSMGPAIAVAGTYHDVVVRDGANWRFKSRRLTHDIAGESGLKPVGSDTAGLRYATAAFAFAKTTPLASVPTAVSTAMMTATDPATIASASP